MLMQQQAKRCRVQPILWANRGLDYSDAHQGALSKYQVFPYSVYHPDVINAINAAEPGTFNPNWLKFWGQQ